MPAEWTPSWPRCWRRTRPRGPPPRRCTRRCCLCTTDPWPAGHAGDREERREPGPRRVRSGGRCSHPPRRRSRADSERPALTDAEAGLLQDNARALLDSDHPSEAISLLEDGVERAGHDPALHLQLRHLLGAALLLAGEYTRAAAVLDAAGRDYRRYLPPDDPVVLDCAYQAGHAYAEIGKPGKALPQLRFYVQNADTSAGRGRGAQGPRDPLRHRPIAGRRRLPRRGARRIPGRPPTLGRHLRTRLCPGAQPRQAARPLEDAAVTALSGRDILSASVPSQDHWQPNARPRNLRPNWTICPV